MTVGLLTYRIPLSVDMDTRCFTPAKTLAHLEEMAAQSLGVETSDLVVGIHVTYLAIPIYDLQYHIIMVGSIYIFTKSINIFREHDNF